MSTLKGIKQCTFIYSLGSIVFAKSKKNLDLFSHTRVLCQNNEKLEDAKWVIKRHKQKDRQYNDQKELEAQWAEPVTHLSFCFEET